MEGEDLAVKVLLSEQESYLYEFLEVTLTGL